MKRHLKKYSFYIFAFIIPIVLLLLLYGIKGAYPFGRITMSNADMGKAYLPAYYSLWDFFHGNFNIFFDFNIGAGTNIYDFGAIYGFLDPTNWLIAITSRDSIPYFLNFILIIKIALISLSSSIVFKKLFKKVDNYIIIFFSLLYAFSGYVLVYHTNIPWLTLTALFPVLILGYKNMLENKNPLLYIITLFLCMIFSFYISYMIILFILFSSFAYLLIIAKKESKNKLIFKLGISTVLAIGLSAAVSFPVLYQTFNSYRFSVNYMDIRKIFDINLIINKLMVLCFYGFPFIYLFKLIKKYKENKKEVIFLLIMLFMTTITIIFDSANQMWHTGNYLLFPYRFAFIPTLLILYGALYYINKYGLDIKSFDSKSKNILGIITATILLIVSSVLYYFAYFKKAIYYAPAYGIGTKVGIAIIVSFIISYIVYLLLIKLNIKKCNNYILISLVFIIQLFFHSYTYICIPNEYQIEGFNDSTDETAFLANEVYNFVKNDKTLFKYKDLDYKMNNNYSLITNKPSISTWHMFNEDKKTSHDVYGYQINFVQLISFGGPIISDQILGINRLLTHKTLGEDYKLIGKTSYYNIYEYNNSLPVGLIYETSNKDNTLILTKDNESEDRAANLNNFYQKLFNKEDNIVEYIDYKKVSQDGKDIITFDVDEKSYIYIDETCDKCYINDITINGEKLIIPFINNDNFTTYSNTINDINIGIYEKTQIKIEYPNKNNINSKLKFVKISYDKLWDLVNNYKDYSDSIKLDIDDYKISVKGKADSNKSMFIPVSYNEGLYAYNNGKKINIDKVFGNYISVDLLEGDNDIVIKFIPPLLNISIIISIICLIVLVLYIKNYETLNIDILNIAAAYAYYVFVIFMLFYIYVSNIISLIKIKLVS